MSRPRPIVPNVTYLLTRRCIERRFLLTPDPEGAMERIFGYCLALTSAKYGILVHASVTLGNHWHLVVTDVKGNLPAFLRDTHSFIARCVNIRRRRCENVWDVRQPSAVRLADTGAIWDKLVYCLTNAVSSGLVASHRAWPGFHTMPDAIEYLPKVYRRPPQYFASGSAAPEEAELVVTKPPALAHLSDDEYVSTLKRRIAAKESELQRKRATHKPFLGIPAVQAQDPHSQPRTPQSRGEINPQVAASDPATRRAHLSLLADFRRLYAKARAKWSEGKRTVRFPYGTYQLFHFHSVPVMAAPT
ncbi:MAG: hypothetical protein R3F39_24840 [Myxococcota bacterium]